MLQADPYALRYAASRFQAGAQELRSQATRLLSHKSDLVASGWSGTAAQTFEGHVEAHAPGLSQNATVLESAAGVLNTLASQIDHIMDLRRQAERYEMASWEYGGDSPDDLHHRQNFARQAANLRHQADQEAQQADSQAAGKLYKLLSLVSSERAHRVQKQTDLYQEMEREQRKPLDHGAVKEDPYPELIYDALTGVFGLAKGVVKYAGKKAVEGAVEAATKEATEDLSEKEARETARNLAGETKKGLETKGYKPQPGERATTREEWEALSRQKRTETNYPKPEVAEKNYDAVKANPNYYTSEGDIVWPPNRGVLGEPETIILKPGTVIDRFGYEGGTFVSPYGVPYEMRALAPETYLKPYNVYVVAKPIEAQAGRIAPWFEEPGLGTQFELSESVKKLLEQGLLRKVVKYE